MVGHRDDVRVVGIKKDVLEHLLSNDYYLNPAEDPNLSDEQEAKRCPLSELCDQLDWGPVNREEIKDAVDELAGTDRVIEFEAEEMLVSIPDYEDAVSLYDMYQEDLL